MARGPTIPRSRAIPTSLVYRITGAFFFGAASAVGAVLDGIADKRKAFVVDFAAVPFLDSTAANVMGRVAAKAQRQGIRLFITGASPAVRRALLTHGVSPPRAPLSRDHRAARSPTSRRRRRRCAMTGVHEPSSFGAAACFTGTAGREMRSPREHRSGGSRTT